MQIQRVKVKGRRFGYKYGLTFLGVKEYRNDEEKPLSFACARPDEVTDETVAKLILQRISKPKNKRRKKP